MDNLKFLKWKKSVYIFCLFSISLFTPQAYAFNPFFGYGLANKTFLISLIIGFIINWVFYAIRKSERREIHNTKSLLDIFLFDFWFDDFVLLKFASFIYFISLSVFYGSVIYYGYMGFSSGSIFFLGLLVSSPLQLILTRFILESAISLVKIAENTKNNNE